MYSVLSKIIARIKIFINRCGQPSVHTINTVAITVATVIGVILYEFNEKCISVVEQRLQINILSFEHALCHVTLSVLVHFALLYGTIFGINFSLLARNTYVAHVTYYIFCSWSAHYVQYICIYLPTQLSSHVEFGVPCH